MRFSPIVLLLFAMLVLVVGCGKKEEAAAPQAQPQSTPEAQSKATPQPQPKTTPEAQPKTTPEAQPQTTPEAQPKAKEPKKAETATLKEEANAWDTPTRLTLFMAQQIEDAFLKSFILIGIASAQVEAGEKEQALATLNQAVEGAQKIENASSKAHALRGIAVALASALAKAGEFKQAVEAAQKIEIANVKATALMVIAEAQVEAGEKEQALATLKQALEAAQKIENAFLKASFLRIIAEAQVEAGEKEQALAKAGDKEQALAEAGEKEQAWATMKQALEMAQKIRNTNRKATALSNIAMTLATEPIPKKKKDNSVVRRMKKSFTPKEKQLAKQLVKAVHRN